ncbi:signal recognition particle protein [Candidatus Binatia bacterium]|jgi:signal recognition particle subunit SRP54|nr:signal recognition particle protein [Candidatus Binatia bacterium]
MFDSLSDKLEGVFRRIRGTGKLTEANIEEAMRDVRMALLEADVHFQVTKSFIEKVRERALGQEVLRALSPEQHLIKIVHEELVGVMGGAAGKLELSGDVPAVIMLVGLQGSGKTTTAAKLAKHLLDARKRRPYLVPLDLSRPAAIQQLKTLAAQVGEGCGVYDTPDQGGNPVQIARDAVTKARNAGFETVILDTAGRLAIDEKLMGELRSVRDAVKPRQTIFVADAMTGQDAVAVAKGFRDGVGIDGVVLSKMEGDARGGAALSIYATVQKPLLFVGVGEKLDALEIFHPDRVASRILGMGDMLSLIEKAQSAYDQKQAEKLQEKLKKDTFTLEDFRDQLRTVKKMGSVADLIGMIPGMKKFAKGNELAGADDELRRIEAIINSMTKQERRDHLILNGSRRKRIAIGSGTSVAEVNKFLKQYQQAKKMMKSLSRGAGKGILAQLQGGR